MNTVKKLLRFAIRVSMQGVFWVITHREKNAVKNGGLGHVEFYLFSVSELLKPALFYKGRS